MSSLSLSLSLSLCGVMAGRKRFYCNLISADRLCWQHVITNSPSFHPEKWGTVPLVYTRKLRLWLQLAYSKK